MDDDLGGVSLDALGPEHVAAWRDRRLKAVSGASVNREWNTLSNVCQVAVREWRWLKASPFTTVKRPKDPEPRSRVITDAERDRILLVCGDNYSTVRGRVGAAFQFACVSHHTPPLLRSIASAARSLPGCASTNSITAR
jgi:hypothetical protein